MRGTDTDARMECSCCGEPVNKPHSQGCLIGLVHTLEAERNELRAQLEAVREWRREVVHPIEPYGWRELDAILQPDRGKGEG